MICAACGHDNPVPSRFCGACGVELTVEAPVEVRKVVTIVFCDLVGSTALGERTDPEVLRGIMAAYHAELRAILERNGGTVEKFVGDAAMAIFGVPQAHEDDAERAVRAATQMRDAVAGLGLEVRIGVNTGEIVAGTGETLATGDAVNVAARLEQHAGTGEVLIGAATERLVRDRVHVEAVDALTLKGKHDPVPAFRVLGMREEVPAFTRPIAAPFVGREDEVDGLAAMLDVTIQTRRPHLAMIVGPPGIGKSRLARELVARTPARVLVGRCLAYGEGITYWPLREICAQVGDVRGALGRSVDADLATTRIGAALGTAAVTVSPEDIAWGVRRLFETLADEEPVVVVFDDVHWAEPTLLELIDYVAAFASDVPLFIVCTSRPDLFEQHAGWSVPRSNRSVTTLEPLSGADSQALVARLGDLPDDTRARIVEAAEGNPLFVEQLVAARVEAADDGFEVPPTLQALLAARIDRLAEGERAVVGCGAIEGRLFHRGAVTALLPEPARADVGTHLLTLVRSELIRPDRAEVPGDDGFRFAHALILDAAYDAIPKRRRAAMHARYADWLTAALGAAAPDEIVAYHLERAARYLAELGEPDLELGDRATRRLAGAARTAKARRDIGATVNLLGRASELAPDDATRVRVLADLAEALLEADETERARDASEQALSLARVTGDEHVEWCARLVLATLAAQEEPEGAASLLRAEADAAISAMEGAGDHEVLARAWMAVSDAEDRLGHLTGTAEALAHALEHARASGDRWMEVTCITFTAPFFVWGPGSVQEGLRYAEEVVVPLGDEPQIQRFALHLRAHMGVRLGEFEGALEAIDEWRGGLRELGMEGGYLQAVNCIWDVCSWAGEWQRGERALREVYEVRERKGVLSASPNMLTSLGEAVFRRGDFEQALRLSEMGEEFSASDDPQLQTDWRLLRAKALSSLGETDEAIVFARRAVELAPEEHLELAAGAWLDLGQILADADAGDRGSQAAATEALVRYERKGNLVGAQRASALLEAAP